MTIERKTLGLICAGVTAVAVGVLTPHVKKEVQWQRKRRKYTQRRVEVFQCIQNADLRLQAASKDPNLTKSDFRKILAEEKTFLKIIENQPL